MAGEIGASEVEFGKVLKGILTLALFTAQDSPL